MYGPFLALPSASAVTVSVVTGFGELVGYGFRLVSGRWADRTGRFWPIAILGYFVQLLAVPALALATNWPTAAIAALIVPTVICLTLLLLARHFYPNPEDLEVKTGGVISSLSGSRDSSPQAVNPITV